MAFRVVALEHTGFMDGVPSLSLFINMYVHYLFVLFRYVLSYFFFQFNKAY